MCQKQHPKACVLSLLFFFFVSLIYSFACRNTIYSVNMLFCAVISCSVVCNSLQPQGLQPTRSLCPWGFSRQVRVHSLLRLQMYMYLLIFKLLSHRGYNRMLVIPPLLFVRPCWLCVLYEIVSIC